MCVRFPLGFSMICFLMSISYLFFRDTEIPSFLTLPMPILSLIIGSISDFLQLSIYLLFFFNIYKSHTINASLEIIHFTHHKIMQSSTTSNCKIFHPPKKNLILAFTLCQHLLSNLNLLSPTQPLIYSLPLWICQIYYTNVVICDWNLLLSIRFSESFMLWHLSAFHSYLLLNNI